MTHSELGASAVMTSAALFYFFELIDILQLNRLIIKESQVASKLSKLLCLHEILAHEIVLFLHVHLPLIEPVTVLVRMMMHVLKPSRLLRLAQGYVVQFASKLLLVYFSVRI